MGYPTTDRGRQAIGPRIGTSAPGWWLHHRRLHNGPSTTPESGFGLVVSEPTVRAERAVRRDRQRQRQTLNSEGLPEILARGCSAA
jgi:hypothetical protein